jgi:hypothetical protein
VKLSLLFPTLLAVVAPWALPGCASSVSQKDASAREWEHAQCLQIIDDKERKRCLERVDSEYGTAR